MTNVKLRAINLAFSIPESLTRELNSILKNVDSPLTEWNPHAVLHLTLFMGIIQDELLDKLSSRIKEVIRSVELIPEGVCYTASGDTNQTIISYCFKRDDVLDELHFKLSTIFGDLCPVNGATSEIFYEGKSSDSSLRYLNEFADKHSGLNYDPHITLGHVDQRKQVEFIPRKESILFEEANLYLMGDGCTCVQILSKIV